MQFVFALFMAIAAVANPPLKSTKLSVRDSQGRVTSTVTVKNNKFVVRDSQGRIKSTGTVKGKAIQMRDSQGRRK